MKRFDFWGQTLIFIGAVTFVCLHEHPTISVLIGQFLLGAWQMISCALSLNYRAQGFKQKKEYFIVSIFYLLVIVILSTLRPSNQDWFFMLMTAPSWVLGLYYYTLTIRIAFPVNRRLSSFLPHINF